MRFYKREPSLFFAGVGALTTIALAGVGFALRFILMRRKLRSTLTGEDSQGASIMEDLVTHNTKGF